MRKLSVIALFITAILFACNKHKDDYRCITVYSTNYIVTRADTVVETDFTAKQAKDYENANTSHGPVGNPAPGDTKATTCTQIL